MSRAVVSCGGRGVWDPRTSSGEAWLSDCSGRWNRSREFFIQEGRHHVGFHLLDPYKWLGFSGHNGSMKDPPHVLTDVNWLVDGFLQQACLLSLKKDCGQQSHSPSGSPPPGTWRGDVWASSQSHWPHWAVSSGRTDQARPALMGNASSYLRHHTLWEWVSLGLPQRKWISSLYTSCALWIVWSLSHLSSLCLYQLGGWWGERTSYGSWNPSIHL